MHPAARLAILIVFCLAVRLLVCLPGFRAPREFFFRPDTSTYLEPARALAEHGRYLRAPDSKDPAVLRAPGFPVFLATAMRLFGEKPALLAGLLCLVSVLTLVPVYGTGRLFGGPAAGLLAAALFGLNLTSIAHAPLILSDTLFTFWTACQLYFFSRFFLHGSFRHLGIAMLMWALATYTKPAGSVWLLAICLLILPAPKMSLPRKTAALFFCILVAILLLFPWMERNRRAGAGFLLETNQANSLLDQAIMIHARAEGIPPEHLRNEWRRELRKSLPAESDASAKTLYDLKMKRFFETLREHPLRFAASRFAPAVLLPDAPTFFELLGMTRHGRGTFFVLREHGLIAAVRHYFRGNMKLLIALIPLLLVIAATYGGCLFQGIRWMRQGRIGLLGFFLVYAGYFLAMPGPMTLPRYHLPALPFICVMAGLWLSTRRIFLRFNIDS